MGFLPLAGVGGAHGVHEGAGREVTGGGGRRSGSALLLGAPPLHPAGIALEAGHEREEVVVVVVLAIGKQVIDPVLAAAVSGDERPLIEEVVEGQPAASAPAKGAGSSSDREVNPLAM